MVKLLLLGYIASITFIKCLLIIDLDKAVVLKRKTGS